MGTWNYRAVRRRYEEGHEEIGIYSVYYDEDGHINGMSADPAPVNSYSLEELKDLLKLMKESLQKPILEYEGLEHGYIATAQSGTEANELRELYVTATESQELQHSDRIKILRALIQNQATPVDVLTSISQLRNFARAPQLRHEAKNALDQQSPKGLR